MTDIPALHHSLVSSLSLPVHFLVKINLPDLEEIQKYPSWPKMLAYSIQEKNKGRATVPEVFEGICQSFPHLKQGTDQERKNLLNNVRSSLSQLGYFQKVSSIVNGKKKHFYYINNAKWYLSEHRK